MAGENGRNDDAIAAALTCSSFDCSGSSFGLESREWWSWSGRPRRSGGTEA